MLQDDKYKFAVIGVLLGISFFLVYYFHFILNTKIIFTHFFYVPIIISAIWWKRKAIIFPLVLAAVLLISNIITGDSGLPFMEDLFRAAMFIFVGIVVIYLAEIIEKSQDTLAESEEKYRSVIESANEAIITVNNHAEIVSWNNAAQYIFGYGENEILGKSVTLLMPERSKKQFENKFKTNENRPKKFHNYDIEFNALRKDGTEFPFELSGAKWEFKGERFFTAIIRDITKRKKIEEALINSEEKYRELFNSANDMISLNILEKGGIPGKFIEINNVGCKRLGYSKDEFLKMTPRDIVAPEKRDQMPEIAAELAKTGHAEYEMVHITKEGKRIPVEINNHIFKFKGKTVALAISRDITERKKAEKQLFESELKYRTLFNTTPDYTMIIGTDGILIDVNEAAKEVTGLSKDDLIGKKFSSLKILLDEEMPLHRKNVSKVLNGEVINSSESRFIDYKGDIRYVETYLKPLRENNEILAFNIVAHDITERKKAEEQLKSSLKEKEMLVKEIHHRVKNNLMVISSLLNLQSRYIKDKESLNIFKESQSRAKSMALIHEKLYRSDDMKKINFGEYIETLSKDLYRTYITDYGRIKLNLDVEDAKIDINTSVPLGLIVNELVSNCMKHAFPANDKFASPEEMEGQINIIFKKVDNSFVLEVKDNGIGFPDDLDYKNTDSLGLQLVNMLVDQIDGQLELNNVNGTEFKIKFKEMY